MATYNRLLSLQKGTIYADIYVHHYFFMNNREEPLSKILKYYLPEPWYDWDTHHSGETPE